MRKYHLVSALIVGASLVGAVSVQASTRNQPTLAAAPVTAPPLPPMTTIHGAHNHSNPGSTPKPRLPTPAVGSATGGLIPEATPIKRPSNDTTGNFRVTCQFSHMSYDDPIVHPNKPGAAHLHTYFGNVAANAASTGASLREAGNSTCDGGTLNRSSYWIPTVLTANGTPVAADYNMIYYKSGYQGVNPGKVASSLPIGLKIIAGNAGATSSQGEPSYVRNVNWSCTSEGWQGRKAFIPDCAPGEEILAEIQFPQCWDGTNLSSANLMSHMAYGQWGVGCPASHPVAIPSISFNIHWKVPAGGTTGWHLSSDAKGTPGDGMSLHGDVILAWDPATSATWLANCVNQNADCNVGQMTDTSRLQFGTRG
jgi:Domain of unknown function (DUF1996)